MDKQDHFISAFPNDGSHANNHHEGGMTLRDYFAAKAMAVVYSPDHAYAVDAENAYKYADAMLAQRAK